MGAGSQLLGSLIGGKAHYPIGQPVFRGSLDQRHATEVANQESLVVEKAL